MAWDGMCPQCGSTDLDRVARTLWMHTVPSKHIKCLICGADFAIIFSGIILMLARGCKSVPKPRSRAKQALDKERKAARERGEPHTPSGVAGVPVPSSQSIAAVTNAQVQTKFGLYCNPFGPTPDPMFLFLGVPQKRMFSELMAAIEDRRGFVVVTGEAGFGKSTLCRKMRDQLQDKAATCLIINPNLSEMQLLASICEEFGIEVCPRNKRSYLASLDVFLRKRADAGSTSVLIIDEAQNMSPKVMESVRMLSNLETNSEKLLQIILVGQPGLTKILSGGSLSQLRQRVNTWIRLTSLSRIDTEEYVLHRLKVAGWKGHPGFKSVAFDSIHERTKGIPRLVNLTCDLLLRIACLSGCDVIRFRMAEDVAEMLRASRAGQGGGFPISSQAAASHFADAE